jgi:uncharacterized membrane protein HdeD (DUF308 family)
MLAWVSPADVAHMSFDLPWAHLADPLSKRAIAVPVPGSQAFAGTGARGTIMFANILASYWWMLLIRGILWILFGLFAFTHPTISIVALTIYIGMLFIVDGAANVVSAIGGRKEEEHWWMLLLAGLAAIGVGILAILNPVITALALVFYLAVWAVATGLLEIGAAIRLRKEISGEIWLILAGVVSVAFGMILVAHPVWGALAMLWFIALFALIFGTILVVLALRARGFTRRLESAGHHGLPVA